MASFKQNQEFMKAIMVQWPLDDAIEWICSNMDIEEIFDEDQLIKWAKDHGFVEASDDKA